MPSVLLSPQAFPSIQPTTQFHAAIGLRPKEDQCSLNFHNCYSLILGWERPLDITVSRWKGSRFTEP